MTVCNMTIEGGGRAGMVAPDDTTFAWFEGRARRRAGATSSAAVEGWRELRTEDGRDVRQGDRRSTRGALSPQVTWGTNPGMVVAGDRRGRPSRPADEATSARCSTWRSSRARRCRRSRSTACSSARARTRASATCAPPPRWSTGRRVADGVHAMVVPGSAAGEGPGRGGGPRRGLPRRRLRLARRRLLDVPGHEPRHPAPGERCASTSNRNFEGRQGRGGRTHLVSPADGGRGGDRGPLRRHPGVELGMEPITIDPRRRHGARPRRRRHRPDHPQAVPQARRAHRLRRVPLLRLGEGARLGAARATRSSPPGATSAAAPRASTRRGRSRTTASARSSRRASPTSSTPTAPRSACCRCAGRGGRAGGDGRGRGGDRPRGPGGRVRGPRCRASRSTPRSSTG